MGENRNGTPKMQLDDESPLESGQLVVGRGGRTERSAVVDATVTLMGIYGSWNLVRQQPLLGALANSVVVLSSNISALSK